MSSQRMVLPERSKSSWRRRICRHPEKSRGMPRRVWNCSQVVPLNRLAALIRPAPASRNTQKASVSVSAGGAGAGVLRQRP